MYTEYSSHWFNYNDQGGCTAIYQCPENAYPAGGISGADMQDYFAAIYAPVADGGRRLWDMWERGNGESVLVHVQ